MYKIVVSAVLFISGCILPALVFADDDCGEGMTSIRFVRDDLSALKKHVQDMLAGIPLPDSPYGVESENWELPGYACRDEQGVKPVDVSYTVHYSVEPGIQAKSAEVQKKIMDAQARGDYQAIAKLSQEMSQQAMSVGMGHAPLDMTVTVDAGDGGVIDPDTVVTDGTGFIALRRGTDTSAQTESVSVYFDPVALKNAHQLASYDTGGDFRVQGKLDFYTLRVDFNGPPDLVEKLVKGIKASTVLSGLTANRKNVENTD